MKSLKSRLLLFLFAGAITSAGQAQGLSGLEPDIFQRSLSNSTDIQLIDLRKESDFQEAHIRNAIYMDYEARDFDENVLSRVDKDRPLYLYCYTGTKAQNAGLYLKELGFKEIYYLKGGLINWITQSKPYISEKLNTEPIAAFTNHDLDKIIARNKNVFIFLSAPWCKYCKIMEPIVRENTGEVFGIKLLKIDGSKELAIAERFQLTDTPTFVYFQNGKQVWRYSGEISEDKLQDILFR